jgi:uncharacterized membrane protein YjfL (UPF0719 family)
MGFTSRWIAFWTLMTLALAAMVFKRLTVCSWVRRHNPAATISVIGGILGAVACQASPSALVKQLWWAPATLDILGAPYLLILMWAGIREWITSRRRSAAIS